MSSLQNHFEFRMHYELKSLQVFHIISSYCILRQRKVLKVYWNKISLEDFLLKMPYLDLL